MLTEPPTFQRSRSVARIAERDSVGGISGKTPSPLPSTWGRLKRRIEGETDETLNAAAMSLTIQAEKGYIWPSLSCPMYCSRGK